MNTEVSIEKFLLLADKFPIIDVRSEGEFEYGHIPGAINIPIFNNHERAVIGTLYKQTGRSQAMKAGLDFIGPKLSSFMEQAGKIVTDRTIGQEAKTACVHCWRGGMRSKNFAWLLNLLGIKTFTLIKGYKAYRNFVLKSFEREAKIIILGGNTGSGKTEVLAEMAKNMEQVIDLERIANHKGSSFGAIGMDKQPTTEQFENILAASWLKLDFSKRIWLEDEAKSIGKVFIPDTLWNKMKKAPIVKINVPKTARIRRLISDYGNADKKLLAEAIVRITKRLGPQHAKLALEELEKGNLSAVADITLTYYDKAYAHDHEKREMKNIFPIKTSTDDAMENAEKVIEFCEKMLEKIYA